MAVPRWAGIPLLLLLAVLNGAARADVESSLSEVMARFAGSPGLQARFVERKEIPLLSAPLETRGQIAFVPPDRFARITEWPETSRLVFDGGKLRFEGGLGIESVDLERDPGLRRFAEELVVLLRGDLAALRDRYSLEFTPKGERWILLLTPRGNAARRFVASIVLAGRGAQLESLEISQPDGSVTHTWFSEFENDRPLSEDVLHRFFGTPPPS